MLPNNQFSDVLFYVTKSEDIRIWKSYEIIAYEWLYRDFKFVYDCTEILNVYIV